MKTWTLDYNNDTGPGDEGFYEWWEVSDGTTKYEAGSEEAAEKLFILLNTLERKDTLLRAAYDLIRRSIGNHYVRSAHETLVRYDEANCDGHCLADDIAAVLDLPDNTKPIPLKDEA